MTTLHDAARKALDAVSDLKGYRDDIDEAIAALRSALEAPEPEPVARCILDNGDELGSMEWLVRPRSVRLENGSLLYAAPPAPAAPARVPLTQPESDHATPSGGQEAGPQEARIEAAYWCFDARRSGYSQWKTAPMSERDAFKAEMRNALEAEKVRAEMRLVARGWRRPARVPLTDKQLAKIAIEDEFLLYCDQESFNEIARAVEAAHGITGGKP